MALVVIHGDDQVVAAAGGDQEEGVGSQRPIAGYAAAASFFNRRFNGVGVFVAKQAVLSSV